MVLISIIIPIYNVEPYIEACLRSIATQSVTEDVECILVDDCGKDNSMKTAEQFVAGYKGGIDFRILHHEHNRGLSAARNTGILAAKGEYVYFLDSDDTITPNCMAGFLKIIEEHPGVDLIQGLIDQDSPYINQFAIKEYPSYTDDRKYIKRALLDYNELPICAANKMVRRQLIVDNNLYFKEGIIHEDNYWSFFLAKHVKALAVYPKKCYRYTENPVSITKAVNRDKEIYSSKIIIEDFCNNIDDFMAGEQKVVILNYLNHVFKNHYFLEDADKNSLYKCLYEKCSRFEKILLRQWFFMRNENLFKSKMFNLCIRAFRMHN